MPYYPDYETALEWYQDLEVCRQVDNIDYVYTMEKLKANIYSFNTQSQRMFAALGFEQVQDEWYVCKIK